jgi:RHS repeat-associated protein
VTNYFSADHLGSVAQVTDAAGAPILTRGYDAWGNLLQGGAASGYAFTGREWDAETGLYYYRARYYAPRAGRFVNEDPIGLAGGINRYEYVRSAPTNFRDPSGKIIECTGMRYVGPPNMVGPTPSGSAGWTGARMTCTRYSCKQRSNGTWGFDAICGGVFEHIFQADPSEPSQESKGMTLGDHENLHLKDYERWYRCQNINRRITTEGFKDSCECTQALDRFQQDLRNFGAAGDTDTERRRHPGAP